MISDTWTVKETGGGAAVTLDSLGFDDFTAVFRNQAPDEVTLTEAVADWGQDEVWSYGTSVDILRNGSLFFRGKVTQTPREANSSGEVNSYVIQNVWRSLERIVYAQDWGSWTNGGRVTSKAHPRILLGRDLSDGSWVDSFSVLDDLISYASGVGVTVAIDHSAATAISIPAIVTSGRSIAELIRQVMQWHPDCVIYAAYSNATTTLTVAQRTTAATVSFDATGDVQIDSAIRKLSDMVPSNVVLSYEAAMTDTDPDIAGETRLQVYRDAYPNDTLSEDTVFAIMPIQGSTGVVGGDLRRIIQAGRPPSHKTHKVPIKCRTLPTAGSTDEATEQWWLDHSGLEAAYGITTADIALPAVSTDSVKAHTVTLNADKIDGPPSVVNPNSTPVWKAPTVGDLPRELVDGTLHDWMGVYATPVIAEVTIAIKKTVVEALGQKQRDEILGFGARIGEMSGVAAYFLDAQVEVMGTDASTQVYEKSVSVDEGEPAETEDVLDQVVPNLAQNLYNARSTAHFEGQVSKVDLEAGGTRYLGKMLNLTHPVRTEWGTMDAVIQAERLQIPNGRTVLSFGPPRQLEIQDWQTLFQGARKAARQRTENADGPVDSTNAGFSFAYEGPAAPVVDGAISPIRNFTWRTQSKKRPRLWGVKVKDGAALEFLPVVGDLYDGDATVTIKGTDTAIAPSDGDFLYLKHTGGVPAAVITSVSLEIGAEPDEYTVTGSGTSATMDEYRKTLASFHGTDPGGDSEIIAESLWIRYLTADSDLKVINPIAENPQVAGYPLSVIEFVPR